MTVVDPSAKAVAAETPKLLCAAEASCPVAVILLAVVVTVPPKVQVRERCAVLLPEEVGFARTLTVQVPPLAVTLLVEQLSVVISNWSAFVPAKTGAEHPVAAAAPEFVSVKV